MIIKEDSKLIPYGKQHINKSDIKAVTDALTSDFLTQGPKIAEFEEAFAKYIGSKYAVALSNGTAALHLCAMALDVKDGDKVITTPITFAASANCIRYCGGEIVFSDINPKTFLIDVKKIRKLLEKHPKGTYKGIVPVDFAGLAVNLQELRELADEFGLWIIEDACHAPGGFFVDDKGNKQNCGNGNFADLSIFSFHPVKHIASGEGGMITTNSESLYKKLLMLRTHGITREKELFKLKSDEIAQGPWYMEMQELGYNYRLTDIQAALGLSQLKRAEAGLEKRIKIAKKYYNAFRSIEGINIQPWKITQGHAYHLYIIQVEDRLGLYEYLRTQNIFPQVHYIPTHLMPYYKQFGWKKGDMPLAEKYYDHCLSLPMYPTLTKGEQEKVINAVIKFIKNGK